MKTTSDTIIATRRLLYSVKGEAERKVVTIGVGMPFLLVPGSVPFNFREGMAGCVVSFDGLPRDDTTVYGADGIQALALASDIDLYLRGLSRKYDFFFETGEPYFDQN